MYHKLVVIALFAALAPRTVHGQRAGSLEIGGDGAVRLVRTPFKRLSVSLPTGDIRLGAYLSDRVQLEPTVSAGFSKAWASEVSVGGTVFAFDIRPGVVVNLRGSHEDVVPFVKPIAGVFGSRYRGEWDTTRQVGLLVGTKVAKSDHLSIRLSAEYLRFLIDDERLPSDRIGLNVGLSFFTKGRTTVSSK